MSDPKKVALMLDKETYENFRIICLAKKLKPLAVASELLEHWTVEHARAQLSALQAVLDSAEASAATEVEGEQSAA